MRSALWEPISFQLLLLMVPVAADGPFALNSDVLETIKSSFPASHGPVAMRTAYSEPKVSKTDLSWLSG